MLDQNTNLLLVDLRLLLPLLVTNAMHCLAAIGILLIGFWLAGYIQRVVVASLSRTRHVDAMLKGFFSNLVRYFVLTITVLAVLSQFGVQTTSLVAVLGAAGLAVGLALQGTLSHLAAGVMLLLFRPFRIGHHVQVGGIDGTVREVSLLWTELVTSDNVQVIVPNGGIWGQPLRNFSVYPQPPATAQIHFRMPGVEPGHARDRIEAIVQASPKVAKTPLPTIWLDRNATDNVLEVVVTFAPADGENAASVKSGLIEAVDHAYETSVKAEPARG